MYPCDETWIIIVDCVGLVTPFRKWAAALNLQMGCSGNWAQDLSHPKRKSCHQTDNAETMMCSIHVLCTKQKWGNGFVALTLLLSSTIWLWNWPEYNDWALHVLFCHRCCFGFVFRIAWLVAPFAWTIGLDCETMTSINVCHCHAFLWMLLLPI